MDFHNFYTIYVFKVKESIADIHTELRCLSDLENLSQLPVQEVLMILSYKFSQYSCFRGQGIHCWYFYRATMFEWHRKSRLTSDSTHTQRYWWMCLIDFWNCFTIHVFEVRESIADISTELPCLGNLEKLGQIPSIQGWLEGTDDCILWIFTISSIFMLSR